jgi:hypothetical protein
MTEQKSPQGRVGIRFWRSGCGSFIASGMNGLSDDYMLDAFLRCWDQERDAKVTRIVMDPTTFSLLVGAYERSLGLPIALRRDGKATDLPYFGASCVCDQGVSDGTMLYYIGKELVGELSGWTW